MVIQLWYCMPKQKSDTIVIAIPYKTKNPRNQRPPKKRRIVRNYIREKKDDRLHNASLGSVLIVFNRPHVQLNLAGKNFDEI